jgi:outer membrane receptor for ferrienterochelin and colicins
MRLPSGVPNPVLSRLIRIAIGVVSLLSAGAPAAAQSDSGRIKVVVRSEKQPIAGAEVRAGPAHVRTDRSGSAVLHLPVGGWPVVIAHVGFRPETLFVNVRAGLHTVVTAELAEQPQELESVVVTATRTAHQVDDEPTRVEVLAGEEIGEKTQTQPGNLTLLLQEMSGVRVQPTAPMFGAAGIRIQGLPGQYTEVLSDGLPLLGAQFWGLSLAEVPPLDLRQVEVIKGASTALYGPSALDRVLRPDAIHR